MIFLQTKSSSFFFLFNFLIFNFKTNLNFLQEEDIIHKANLLKLIFVKSLSCVFNISFNIMQIEYIGH